MTCTEVAEMSVSKDAKAGTWIVYARYTGARIQIVQVKMRIPYYKFYGTM